MRFDRTKLLRFVAWFVPLFVVLLALYPFIVPFYEPLVLGAANTVMARMDPPTEMGISRWGAWQGFNVERGYRRAFVTWGRGASYLHFLSLALLPALLLATPAPWRVRFTLLVLAIPLLFAAHTLAVIGLTRTHYCFVVEPKNVSCRIVYRIVSSSGQLFGATLWAVLTFRYWFARERPPAAEPRASDGSAGDAAQSG
jgi:hypothetical protein